ncbi:DUF4331 domain-containing protein [Streptomyces monticola]|uniref:DUF4331 domain-containing protein n=1 Tax=Streptomyces monticola TaxID=2666263 RepID=A0ABW2JUK9_9ACTN
MSLTNEGARRLSRKNPRLRKPHLYAIGATVTVSVLAAAALAGPGTGTGHAGSHVDAPSAILNPDVNGADLFAFTSPDNPDMVTLAVTYNPITLPQAGGVLPPALFGKNTRYDINVDSSGDGKPDLTYRWTFDTEDKRIAGIAQAKGHVNTLDDKDLLLRQRYTLQELRPGKAAKTLVNQKIAAPTRAGLVSMPDYGRLMRQATYPLPGGGKTYAGQASDPFFIDVRHFAMLKLGVDVPVPVNPLIFSNVNVMSVQVPKKQLALKGDPGRNPVAGVWASAARKSLNVQGGKPKWVQVSRVGQSFFNEGLSPDGFLQPGGLLVGLPGGVADQFNARRPQDDHRWKPINDMVRKPGGPHLVNLFHFLTTPPPKQPRDDLWQILMKGVGKGNGPVKQDLNAHALNRDASPSALRPAEMLRLNMSVPPSAKPKLEGWLEGDRAGFPNGRRFTDDATLIFSRIILGEPAGKGHPELYRFSLARGPVPGVAASFPYVAEPRALP